MVSQGYVLSADIHVCAAISGPVIHVAGSDKAMLRDMAERLDGLHNAGEPLLIAYEQVAKLDIDAARTTLTQRGNDPDQEVLRVAIDDADALPTGSNGWIATIGQSVVEDWSISHQDGVADIALRTLTPEHRALLRSSLSGETPAPD